MYRVLQVLTLLLFCNNQGFAQNQLYEIRGRVVDLATKNPLEGALVYAKKVSQVTITNADGSF